MSSELINILEREAGADRERILAEAHAQTAQILESARAQAAEFQREQRAQLEAQFQAARVRAQSAANLKGQALILEEKDKAIADVFGRAQAGLDRLIVNRQRYKQVLERLAREAVGGFSDTVIVEANPDDVPLLKGLDALEALAQKSPRVKLQVRPAEGIKGGVCAMSPDGRYVVVNTLAFRLERARPMLASEVAAVLWGSSGTHA